MAPRKGSRAETRREQAQRGIPWLEWVASGVGVVTSALIVGVLAWDAFHQDAAAPSVHVEARRTSQTPDGFTLEIVARNRTGATAAQVEIEGSLIQDGRTVETARTLIDYVPGGSSRQGGLFFTQDPRRFDTRLRALGYAAP